MKRFLLCLALSVLTSVSLTGCGKTEDNAAKSKDPVEKKPAHPTTGPNKGSLIELGDDEYHGELVRGKDDKTATIYILDGSATKHVPIEAKDVIIELTHAGKRKQYKLEATPRDDDPKDKSSRFVLADKELSQELTHKDAKPKLILKIGGKPYSGPIKPGKHVH